MAKRPGSSSRQAKKIVNQALSHKGTKNYGLGSASSKVHKKAGKLFVGKGSKAVKDGVLSADKKRLYRPLSWKAKRAAYQSNLVEFNRPATSKRLLSKKNIKYNGHIDK